MDSKFPLQFDRSIPFVESIFRIIEETAAESEAVDILTAAEQATGVELSSVCPYPVPPLISDDEYLEIVVPRMEALLSETNLILGIVEFDVLYPLFESDKLFEWGHRGWGIFVSQWANKARWLGKEDWSYLDFYAGPNNLIIKDYDAWSQTVLRVIRRKSRTRIESLLPIEGEIINTLLNDPDDNKRLMAIGTLAGFETDSARAALEHALRTEEVQRVRARIQQLLT